jgi:hypothetical protein
LKDAAPAVMKKTVQMAKDGNVTALRLVVTRVLAPLRDDRVDIDMVSINNPIDAALALTQIASAVASGEMTHGQGRDLAALIAPLLRGLAQDWEIERTDITDEIPEGDGTP